MSGSHLIDREGFIDVHYRFCKTLIIHRFSKMLDELSNYWFPHSGNRSCGIIESILSISKGEDVS